jgi:hypothetical protein
VHVIFEADNDSCVTFFWWWCVVKCLDDANVEDANTWDHWVLQKSNTDLTLVCSSLSHNYTDNGYWSIADPHNLPMEEVYSCFRWLH